MKLSEKLDTLIAADTAHEPQKYVWASVEICADTARKLEDLILLYENTLAWVQVVCEDDDFREARGGGYKRAELLDYIKSVVDGALEHDD